MQAGVLPSRLDQSQRLVQSEHVARCEPTELMEIRLGPVEEALRMARGGEITDGPSALVLLWCETLLK